METRYQRKSYQESPKFDIKEIVYHGLTSNGWHEGEIFFEDGTIIYVVRPNVEPSYISKYQVEKIISKGTEEIDTEDYCEYEDINEIDFEIYEQHQEETKWD